MSPKNPSALCQPLPNLRKTLHMGVKSQREVLGSVSRPFNIQCVPILIFDDDYPVTPPPKSREIK